MWEIQITQASERNSLLVAVYNQLVEKKLLSEDTFYSQLVQKVVENVPSTLAEPQKLFLQEIKKDCLRIYDNSISEETLQKIMFTGLNAILSELDCSLTV